MKSGERETMEAAELSNQENVRTIEEKKITRTYEYWKLTP